MVEEKPQVFNSWLAIHQILERRDSRFGIWLEVGLCPIFKKQPVNVVSEIEKAAN